MFGAETRAVPLNYWPAQRVNHKVDYGALAQVPGRVDWMELLAELTAMY